MVRNKNIQYFPTYKVYNGIKYHRNFPDKWILNELPSTGRDCHNCIGTNGNHDGFAMWRKIVLGYCANCAESYEGTRGRGFYCYGIEFDCPEYESAFSLYLGNVDFENYGDLQDNPMHTVKNREFELARETIETVTIDHNHDHDHAYTDEEEYSGSESDTNNYYYLSDDDDL